MEKNLENYLTEEEKKKMDEIVSRAVRRREESGEKEDGALTFEFVAVSCQCQEPRNEKESLGRMLEGMCQCIREHGRCPREDELLPF